MNERSSTTLFTRPQTGGPVVTGQRLSCRRSAGTSARNATEPGRARRSAGIAASGRGVRTVPSGPIRPEARPNPVRISQRWRLRAILVGLVLLLLACGPSGGFAEYVFWQEVGDRPGREPDPYSNDPNCELVREELRGFYDDPDDITTGTVWIKRVYLCPAGTT